MYNYYCNVYYEYTIVDLDNFIVQLTWKRNFKRCKYNEHKLLDFIIK